MACLPLDSSGDSLATSANQHEDPQPKDEQRNYAFEHTLAGTTFFAIPAAIIFRHFSSGLISNVLW